MYRLKINIICCYLILLLSVCGGLELYATEIVRNCSFGSPKKIDSNIEFKQISFKDSVIQFLPIDTVGLNGALDCVIQIFTSEENRILNRISIKKSGFCSKSKMESDSLGFRYRRISGIENSIISENYKNAFINLDYRVLYNDGKLNNVGFCIDNVKIGPWKYFSKLGELDSIVTYEYDELISFCELYEIAKSFGLVGMASKLPDRQTFCEIAESHNLTIHTPKYVNGKVGWPSKELVNIPLLEERGEFTSNFSYYKIETGYIWVISKFFNVGAKRFGYGLSIDSKAKEVVQFEYDITVSSSFRPPNKKK